MRGAKLRAELNAVQREWRRRHSEAYLAQQRKYYYSHREEILRKRKERYLKPVYCPNCGEEVVRK